MAESVASDRTPPRARSDEGASTEPARAQLVLVSLILVAAVANLNLSVANVALPDIGESFDSSQTMLNLIAVGYSLGLAASVIWLGAIGDRYGRKLMILLGMGLSVPASLVAGFAPSDTVLFGARVVGGISAGLAYPTTLALITALWSGPARFMTEENARAFGGSCRFGLEHLDDIVRMSSRERGFPEPLVRRYLTENLALELTSDYLKGLDLFWRYADDLT